MGASKNNKTVKLRKCRGQGYQKIDSLEVDHLCRSSLNHNYGNNQSSM